MAKVPSILRSVRVPMASDAYFVNFEVHYNGRLYRVPRTRYSAGDMVITNGFDRYCLSFFEVEGICSKYGYERDFDMIYYKVPGMNLDTGLKMINNDSDVLEMVTSHQELPVVILYVVKGRPSQHSEVIPCTSTGNEGHISESRSEAEVYEETVGYEAEVDVADGLEESDAESGEDGFDDAEVDGLDADVEANMHGYDSDLQKETPEERTFWKEVISSEDDLFDVSVKELLHPKKKSVKELESKQKKVRKQRDYVDTGNLDETTKGKEVLSDYGDSDELHSPEDNSDFEDYGRKKYDEFIESRDMGDPEITLGMKFASVKVFRKAIREWNIKRGKDLKWKKNDPKKVIVVCKSENCDYRVYGSLITGEDTFQIKSLNPTHECTRAYKNSQVNSKWIADKYTDKLRNDPTWKVKSIKYDVSTSYKVDASRSQVYRAIKTALDVIHGNHKESYTRVWDYCATLLHHNEGSCVKMHVERPFPNGHAIFQRLYVSLDAMRRGFKEGCRPLIGLDACHLKGPYGGQLISAVGRDPNDNIFPIAIAAVEQENKDSWTWFLTTLLNDIGSVEENGWTFISDRQKGLIPSFKELIPSANLRICVRHLYANYRDKGHRGKALKDKLWGAATAYTVREFEKAMKDLEDYDKEAFRYLNGTDRNLWCRAYFSTNTKTDLLVNNLSESFNAYIMEARDKPLVAMVEMIRRKLMTRFQVKREGMDKYTGRICPKIQMKLEKNKELSFYCLTHYAGDGFFEVESDGTTYVLSLKDKTCGCRVWDMTGIPCHHAVSAIWLDGGKPEDYVSHYYSKETYMKAYEAIIYPVPSEGQWQRTDKEDVAPPVVHKAPGRPKKLRRRGPDEPKNPYRIRKTHTIVRCGTCKQLGHNGRTCPLKSGSSYVNVSQSTVTSSSQPSIALRRGQASTQQSTNNQGRGVSSGRGIALGRGRGRGIAQVRGGQASTQQSTNNQGKGIAQGRGRGIAQGRGVSSGRGIAQGSGAPKEKIYPDRPQTRAYYIGDEHGNFVHPKGKKRPTYGVQPQNKRVTAANPTDESGQFWVV